MCDHDRPIRPPATPVSRRAFVTRSALAAGVALVSTVAPWRVMAAGNTEALLLSCMDYRLMDDIVRYMDGRGLTDKYDHVILAGAALGVLNDRYPAWGQTFWDHVGVAIELHHIAKIIVMDHRDCGAYKVFLGPDVAKDAATERATHVAELHKLRAEIGRRRPGLAVELLLMDLAGRVETIA